MNATACYLIRRTAWDCGYSYPISTSHAWQGSAVNPTGERFVAVALFLTEGEAEAEAHRLNAAARAGRSPFWFDSDWEELTDLTPDEATARLLRKGFNPPQMHPDVISREPWRVCDLWREWWDRESVNWTAEQLADAWAVFSKLRFYDVVEIEMED